ncbi:MAG: flagellar assembly protein FliX [Pseudomonadota bacterium]
MKVEGPGKTGKTQKGSKSGGAKKSGDNRFGSMISGSEETESTSSAGGASGVGPAAALETLLSLQEADDSTSEEARARAKKRANDVLDQLEHIRMGLLMGGISGQALSDLSQLVADRKDEVDDPNLREIMEEIDLRAQVELAKFNRS